MGAIPTWATTMPTARTAAASSTATSGVDWDAGGRLSLSWDILGYFRLLEVSLDSGKPDFPCQETLHSAAEAIR
jgi:hypothetical protein